MNSATTPSTTPTMSGLEKAANFVTVLTLLDQGMKLSELQILLYVAQNQDQENGLTTADLRDGLGLSNPAASRITYYWADGITGVAGTGLGMIDITIDSTDRRRWKNLNYP